MEHLLVDVNERASEARIVASTAASADSNGSSIVRSSLALQHALETAKAFIATALGVSSRGVSCFNHGDGVLWVVGKGES